MRGPALRTTGSWTSSGTLSRFTEARLRGLSDGQTRRSEVEHRHIGLDDGPSLDLRHGHPENTPVGFGDGGQVGHRDVNPIQPERPVRMVAGPWHLPSPLGERGQVLDEKDRCACYTPTPLPGEFNAQNQWFSGTLLRLLRIASPLGTA